MLCSYQLVVSLMRSQTRSSARGDNACWRFCYCSSYELDRSRTLLGAVPQVCGGCGWFPMRCMTAGCHQRCYLLVCLVLGQVLAVFCKQVFRALKVGIGGVCYRGRHDLTALLWLAGQSCRSITSSGVQLSHVGLSRC